MYFTQPNQFLTMHCNAILGNSNESLKIAPNLNKTLCYSCTFFLVLLQFHFVISLQCALHLFRGRTHARPGTGAVGGPELHLWCTHGRVIGLLPSSSQTVPGGNHNSWSSWDLLLWRLELVWSQPSPAKYKMTRIMFTQSPKKEIWLKNLKVHMLCPLSKDYW